MLSTTMFATTAVFSFIVMAFFPEWTWLPQTVEQTIAEGLIVIMLFLSTAVMKLEQIERKVNER